MISKGTAQSLLRVLQSPSVREEFPASKVLREFVAENGIGLISHNKAIFGHFHKERIRALLLAMNIDPDTAPDAWSDCTRTKALAIGPDEKWTERKVRGSRIAIKALEGCSLIIDGRPLWLPRGANLEWSVGESLSRVAHSAVVVVENWETFEEIDWLQVDFSPAGSNPLILWRGGGQNATVGAAYEFLRGYGKPVWSAPDYDPAGLLIAASLPNLAGVLSPPAEKLVAMLESCRLHQRFMDQLPGAQAALNAATHADIKRLWAIVQHHGKALPQEYLTTADVNAD
jgi:hypothetical protein